MTASEPTEARDDVEDKWAELISMVQHAFGTELANVDAPGTIDDEHVAEHAKHIADLKAEVERAIERRKAAVSPPPRKRGGWLGIGVAVLVGLLMGLLTVGC